MATYVALMNLTTEGRRRVLAVPDTLMVAQKNVEVPGVSVYGMYATLGQYDFVAVISAPDNDSAARFSMEMGVAAGLEIITLPAIPIGRFETALSQDDPLREVGGAPLPQAEPDYGSAPS